MAAMDDVGKLGAARRNRYDWLILEALPFYT
jgi:hypothetical protein